MGAPRRNSKARSGDQPNAAATASGSTPSLPSASPAENGGGSLQVYAPVPPPPDPLGVPSVPRWKRGHDSKMRKKVARILVLKMAGHKTAEIARRMKTTPDTIRHYLYIAGKNGWLSPDGLEMVDPAEQLMYEGAHKIVRNIHHALDGKILNSQQFEMTVEAAKGTGLFKNHSAAKVEGAISFPALEVKFEMPRFAQPVAPSQLDPTTVGGTPNFVEGQVVDRKQIEAGQGAGEGEDAS